MTLKLYYASGACSFVPHSMLEMAGATFEPVAVKLHRNEQNIAARLHLMNHYLLGQFRSCCFSREDSLHQGSRSTGRIWLASSRSVGGQ